MSRKYHSSFCRPHLFNKAEWKQHTWVDRVCTAVYFPSYFSHHPVLFLQMWLWTWLGVGGEEGVAERAITTHLHQTSVVLWLHLKLRFKSRFLSLPILLYCLFLIPFHLPVCQDTHFTYSLIGIVNSVFLLLCNFILDVFVLFPTQWLSSLPLHPSCEEYSLSFSDATFRPLDAWPWHLSVWRDSSCHAISPELAKREMGDWANFLLSQQEAAKG